MEEIEDQIKHFKQEGDWLELNDYLQDSQFEELVEQDPSFQKVIVDTIKELFGSISFSDSEKD